MPRSSDDLLIQRLKYEGERLTWAINSTVYTLESTRFIVWVDQYSGLGVAPLPAEYGPDHYEAAVSFLRDVREGFKA